MLKYTHKSSKTGFFYQTDRHVCLMHKEDVIPPDKSDLPFEQMVETRTSAVCGDADLKRVNDYYILDDWWMFPAERIEMVQNFVGPNATWKKTSDGCVWAYNADKSKQGLAMCIPERVVYVVGPSTFATFKEAKEFADMMGLTVTVKGK